MFECRICGMKHKRISKLQEHVTRSHDIKLEEYYLKYLNNETDLKCPICGKRRKFFNFANGFRITCFSRRCGNEYGMLKKYGVRCGFLSKEIQKKIKETNLKKYGAENPFKSDIVKKKIKETNLRKYGVEHALQNEKIKEKRKLTNIEKYGVNSPLKSKEIRKKIEETCFKKYGTKSSFAAKEVKEKIKQTNLRKYGVENPNQNENIKSNKKKTCLKKYGVENPSQSRNIKEKKKQSSLKRYGTNSPLQAKEVKEKIKETCLDRYGVENPSQNENIKHKKEQTSLKNYGEISPWKNKEFKRKSSLNRIKKMIPYIKKFLQNEKLELLSEYKGARESLILKCKKCGTEFESNWLWVLQSCLCGKCPKCYPYDNNKSIAEKEISNYVRKLGFDIKTNDKKIIKPLELDIVIEDKKIAIEYCGLYWHSSGGKGIHNPTFLNYHKNKLEKCVEKRYKLITIFENEWLLKQDIVKARLKHILGVDNSSIKIRASKCEIKEIDPKIKNEFLNEYHIQGGDNSRIKLGAYYADKLVSVMTFSKGNISKGSKLEEGIWELNRFCSHPDYHIYGIASKMLKHFQENFEWDEIFSYADRRWSNGNLYNQLGFELIGITKPNYWYSGKNILGLLHRFNFRKSTLKDMKYYDSDLTEFQIMSLEGYRWIYDCGNLKFILRRSRDE